MITQELVIGYPHAIKRSLLFERRLSRLRDA